MLRFCDLGIWSLKSYENQFRNSWREIGKQKLWNPPPPPPPPPPYLTHCLSWNIMLIQWYCDHSFMYCTLLFRRKPKPMMTSWNGNISALLALCAGNSPVTGAVAVRLLFNNTKETKAPHPRPFSLLWRHNDHDSVSNHQPHCCLFSRLFRHRWKKTSKLRVTGLCVGNSPGPVNSPHKGPVTRKMFPFDDVIMFKGIQQ